MRLNGAYSGKIIISAGMITLLANVRLTDSYWITFCKYIKPVLEMHNFSLTSAGWDLIRVSFIVLCHLVLRCAL